MFEVLRVMLRMICINDQITCIHVEVDLVIAEAYQGLVVGWGSTLNMYIGGIFFRHTNTLCYFVAAVVIVDLLIMIILRLASSKAVPLF